MALTLSKADSGSTYRVRPGEPIAVRLAENLSTGYGWAVERVDGLTFVGTGLKAGTASGGSGERTFNFVAGQAGTGSIALKLWRDWLGEAGVSERFTVTIEVA